jgi:hypothetical protein
LCANSTRNEDRDNEGDNGDFLTADGEVAKFFEHGAIME